MAGNIPDSESKMENQGDADDGEDDHLSTEEEGSDDASGENSCDDNSDDSMDGTLDKCPICLRVFRQQEVGTPDTCEHCFCLKCIMEWAENVTTCPIDRKVFHSVLILDKVRGHVVRVQELAAPSQSADYYDDFSDPTFCEVCGCCDREDRLLLCDDCDDGYHLECLDPPLDAVPDADWWCSNCTAARARALNNIENVNASITHRPRSRMPRTGLSRRIMQRRRRDTTTVDLCSPNSTTEFQPAARRKRSESSSAGTSSRRSVSRGRRRTVSRRSHSVKKRRGKKRRTRKRRVAMERKPATSRGRLIQQLGILPPRPGQVYVGLPSCRPSHTPAVEPSTSAAAIRTQRHQAGIAPLRIYSTVNDLADYFEISSDEEGSVGVMRPQPIRISDCRKRILASAAAQQSSSVNILDSILSGQHILLQDKNMQISSGDGRLVPSISVDVQKLLLSPNHEYDSSGYDSFGTRGSPTGPGARRPPTSAILTTAITPNSGSSSSGCDGSRPGSSGAGAESSNLPVHSATISSNSYRTTSGLAMNSHPTSSYSRGSGDDQSNSFEDLGGLDDGNRCAQRKKENSTESEKEEDEYNIYSDIEDDPRPITRRSLDMSVPADVDPDPDTQESPVIGSGGGGAGESDDEMVIDEADEGTASGSGQADSGKRTKGTPNVSSDQGNIDAENEDVMSDNGSEPLLGDMEPDSPLSIPLPDSTPPPSVRGGPSLDDDDSPDLSSSDEAGKVDEGKADQLIDAYDPSHPLTSSDEDEVPLPDSSPTTPIWETKSKTKGEANSSEADRPHSPIPLPTATGEEGRRPTIQFSIPSRHRFFSVGSLMRRNSGVMKKETKAGSSISFQSEMSKAFASKSGDEVNSGGGDGEKVSLVAEIFGFDEDEEEGLPPISALQMGEDEPVKSPEQPPAQPLVESTTEPPSQLEGNKWKKIVEDTEPVVSVPPVSQLPSIPSIPPVQVIVVEDDDVVVIGETPPEVQIIETPPPEPEDESPKVELPAPPPASTPPLASPDEEDDPNEGIITIAIAKVLDEDQFRNSPSPSPKSEHHPSPSDSEGEFERQRLREKRLNAKRNDEEKKRKSPRGDKGGRHGRKRSRSRSFSIDSNNREEGEILDIPDKRKKKTKKSKKSKRRRRSTRSRSSSSSDVVSFTAKKVVEEVHVQQPASEEEDARRDVRWKKPSKSSKQRNYRDGKPKTEERYFREREKEREKKMESDREREREREREKERERERERERAKSESLRRSIEREEVRKERERSRTRERKSNRRRLSPRRRRSRSKHSNRSSSSVKNYRSRSRSVHSKSSRSRQGRHYRDQSYSPVQWRASPPRENRRSRHRSRSATKRHQSSRKRSRSDGGRRQKPPRKSQSSSRSNSPPSPRRKKNVPIENQVPKKLKKDIVNEVVEPVAPEVETGGKVAETIPEKVEGRKSKAEKENNVEKDKRKKRKRREKSISPAKAIFADGDSIVVSLNFQKGKDTSEKDSGGSEGKRKEDVSSDKRRSNSKDKAKEGKSSKAIKKTVLIDLECSPIQEQNIGTSPTLIVLSDDDDHHDRNLKPGDDSDPDRLAVSTTSMGEPGKSPLYRERDCHGVPADSTQVQLHSNDEPKGLESHGRHSLSESDTGNTPARGDALVTSTRDSVDRNGSVQEEYPLSPCSTPPKEPSTPTYTSLTPPLPPGSPPPTTTAPPPTLVHSPETSKIQASIMQILSVNPPPPVLVPGIPPTVTRPPVGIPNIQTLPTNPNRPQQFPGTGQTQIPIITPTPQPIQQLRLPSQNLFNQSVLATVANALYGPLMNPQPRFPIVQQSAPGNPISSRMPGNVIGKKATSGGGGTVLLPKDQNFTTQKRTEGGDSPFSPNSSEGDDLFEPPKESGHQPTTKSAIGSSGQGHKGSTTEGHSTEGGGGGGKGNKGRPAARIFDALFGGPIRKPSSTSAGNQPKLDGSKISKSSQKPKSKKGHPRKPTSNLSEGELRLTEEVPTSAVELHVKEKFLKKLNRQERVVEEVKVSLKPHYSKKHITKEEYKDILRRAVPKICHNKTGEINPIKIKELVEAYVKKIRKIKKK